MREWPAERAGASARARVYLIVSRIKQQSICICTQHTHTTFDLLYERHTRYGFGVESHSLCSAVCLLCTTECSHTALHTAHQIRLSARFLCSLTRSLASPSPVGLTSLTFLWYTKLFIGYVNELRSRVHTTIERKKKYRHCCSRGAVQPIN